MTQFSIGSTDLRGALQCGGSSIFHWMKGVPRQRQWSTGAVVKGGSTPDRFRLSDIVVALRAKRKRGLNGESLLCVVELDNSVDDPTVPLGDDAGGRAAALMACLSDVEKERFARVVRWARDGVTFVLWDRAHLVSGRDLGTLILHPSILVYTLTGQQKIGFPTTREAWGNLVEQHVETNSETMKEKENV